MIGPKQFDIKHKVKPRREFDNPIVTRIFEPVKKYLDDDLKGVVKSLANDFKIPDHARIIPITKDIKFSRDQHEHEFKKAEGSFLDRFKPLKKEENVAKEEAKNIIKKKEKKNFISLADSIINKDKAEDKREEEKVEYLPKIKERKVVHSSFHFPLFMLAPLLQNATNQNKLEEEKERKEEITEDMINKITYKVFSNIKDFLRKEEKPERNKSLKLEIDF